MPKPLDPGLCVLHHQTTSRLRLSLLLCSRCTYDCISSHPTDTTVKCAHCNSVVGLSDSEMAHRDEVSNLVMWCGRNNLSVSVGKTNEVILEPSHTPVCINNSPVSQTPSHCPAISAVP